MVSEIKPRSLPYFTEPMPAFAEWPDAPCAYIKFTSSYDWDFRQAQQACWPVQEINAGHFHMLVDAVSVTEAIIQANS
jgi:hypothetical protein